MESGLEGRNNDIIHTDAGVCFGVSMESGLEGRNNSPGHALRLLPVHVSMESGLEGRNNLLKFHVEGRSQSSLNGVRPRRPEQFDIEYHNVRLMHLSQWSPA